MSLKTFNQFIGSESSFYDTAIQTIHQNNCVSLYIQGKRCLDEKELFHEFAAALQFPYYFGNNWDAFDECIHDLSWLPSKKIYLFIANADSILFNNFYHLKIFNKILLDAMEHNNIIITLHSTPENKKELLKKG